MAATDLFTEQDRLQIKNAIADAELLTSGEIRVYIEDECKGDVLDRAAFVFEELEMHKTEERNGVLIYLASDYKKFAIIGDVGIHVKVGDGFWKSIKEKMVVNFRAGNLTEGLSVAIKESGVALSKYFPRRTNDKNELSDEIVFGNEG